MMGVYGGILISVSKASVGKMRDKRLTRENEMDAAEPCYH